MAGAHRATARATSAGVETLGGVGTAADIEALLRQVTPAAGAEEGFTTTQAAESAGLSVGMTRQRLRHLLALGQIEPCQVRTVDMGGRWMLVRGYRRVHAAGAAATAATRRTK